MQKTQIRAQWFDIDRENVVFYGNYFRYFTTAEDAFLHAAGMSRDTVKRKYNVDFARVYAECTYKQPIRYDEEIVVETRAELENEYHVTFFFRVTKKGREEVVAEGRVRAVCVSLGQTFQISQIPEEVRTKLQTAINETGTLVN